MEKQFIPSELAEKLKELGFNEPCIAMYFCGKFAIKLQGTNKEFETVINSEMTKTLCAAPLWQQAFDWFREKHKLHYNLGFIDDIIGYMIQIENIESNTVITDSEYRTNYNEARIACLEKLIEITTQH